MGERVAIELQPLGTTLHIRHGAPLRDVLFAHGVEFPCGGRGRCKGCRIKVLSGAVPITAEDARSFTASELATGWRLGCAATVHSDVRLEIGQWDAPVLCDDTAFEFTPQRGLGIAVDLGTTTIAAQLLDLGTAQVLAVRSALNPQAQYGGDVMSRIQFALDGGAGKLTASIRDTLGMLVSSLLEDAQRPASALTRVVIVGNTVMHHLFSGIDVVPLAHSPFESPEAGLRTFTGAEVNWPCREAVVEFLPCLGGFVGSDVLAGVLATRIHEQNELQALIDLGTNGEIVVGNSSRLLCASTAAGPAFEGARISRGMRAMTGAISEVQVVDGRVALRVIGDVEARGICGSGLVDAVVAGRELGCIEASGRLRQPMQLSTQVELTQGDVREVQLAKGAIAAGVQVLLQQWGATERNVARVFLAGAFGNYINRENARRLGLLAFRLERIHAAGNTALLGAKLALFVKERGFANLRGAVRHVSLADDPDFQRVFVSSLRLELLSAT